MDPKDTNDIAEHIAYTEQSLREMPDTDSTVATEDAEQHLRGIVDAYRSLKRWHNPHYREALEELIEEAEKWLNAKP